MATITVASLFGARSSLRNTRHSHPALVGCRCPGAIGTTRQFRWSRL